MYKYTTKELCDILSTANIHTTNNGDSLSIVKIPPETATIMDAYVTLPDMFSDRYAAMLVKYLQRRFRSCTYLGIDGIYSVVNKLYRIKISDNIIYVRLSGLKLELSTSVYIDRDSYQEYIKTKLYGILRGLYKDTVLTKSDFLTMLQNFRF